MLGSVKDYVREALITTALFGSIGVASAQAPVAAPAPQSDTDQAVAPVSWASVLPAKFSPQGDMRDDIPLMARGPALSEAQRQQIINRVMGNSGARIDATPPTGLDAEAQTAE
jgi:hypothetical protein